MLDAIKSFFEENFLIANEQVDKEHALKLATAAILIEMMQQDHEVSEREKQIVKNALSEKFALNDEETSELFVLAKQELKDATDYHQFTSLITQNYTQPQKIKIIEYLWDVAYADGQLHKYEEHMVRRIADLIHVSHKDFLQAKHRSEERNGI